MIAETLTPEEIQEAIRNKERLDYEPTTTVQKFMLDNDHLVRVLVGPLGSGKSMGAIMEILRRSIEQKPMNGIRSTRWAIIRNTMAQLRTTVLTDIQQYLGPLLRYYTTDHSLILRVALPDGTMVHSDWLMIPLDTAADQRRLLSLQLTGAWINEVREVPFGVVDALIARLGRYPSKINGGPSWHGLICDTNPWDEDSPYHEVCVLNPRPTWKLYHQPGGLEQGAENVSNLPPNYYENLASGKDTGWIDVHVNSQFGTSNAGQAVFRRSFHAPTHVKDMDVMVNPHRPVMVGMDFGRTPCALLCQIDNAGRLLVFKEITTESMGIIQMVEDYLKPLLHQEPYAGKRVFIVADPAGTQRSQVTEESPFDALKDAGFLAYPASTNNVEPRLRAVEKLFRSTLMGEAAIQINRAGCPTLVQALGSKYRYRRRKDGQFDDIPEKLHPWSDIADALQYACLGAQTNLTGRVLARELRRTSYAPRIPVAAWT